MFTWKLKKKKNPLGTLLNFKGRLGDTINMRITSRWIIWQYTSLRNRRYLFKKRHKYSLCGFRPAVSVVQLSTHIVKEFGSIPKCAWTSEMECTDKMHWAFIYLFFWKDKWSLNSFFCLFFLFKEQTNNMTMSWSIVIWYFCLIAHLLF